MHASLSGMCVNHFATTQCGDRCRVSPRFAVRLEPSEVNRPAPSHVEVVGHLLLATTLAANF